MQSANQYEEHIEQNNIQLNGHLLHDLHEKQLLNGENNNDSTLNIVHALGGIDLILKDYLHQNNHVMMNRLSQNQLNQIKQIITTPQKYKQRNKLKLKSFSNINQNDPHSNMQECIYHLEYEFWDKNIFLKKIFDERTVHKTIEILYSKNVVIISVLLAMSSAWIADTMLSSWIQIACGLSICCILMVYNMFVIMSCNIIAIKKVICSFEFWFKIYIISAICCVWTILRYHALIKLAKEKQLTKPYLIATMIYFAVWLISCFFWTLMICLFDALSVNFVNRNYKIFWAAFAAFYVLYLSILYQFFNPEENDYIIRIQVTNMIYSVISCRSLNAYYLRILCIFFFKQMWLIIYNKDKCVLIKYTPFVKWIKEQNNHNKTKVELEGKQIARNKKDETVEKMEEIVNDELFFNKKEEFDDLSASEVVMKVSHTVSVSLTDVSGSIAL